MYSVSILTTSLGALAVIFNGLLLPIIYFQSPKAMGRYKWLMFLYTITGLIYSICTLCTVPRVILSEGGWLIYASWTPFPQKIEALILSIFPIVILAFFIILEHMFAYRYCCVVELQFIMLFRETKSCSYLILVAFLRILFFIALPSVFYLRNNDQLKELFSVVLSPAIIHLDLKRTSYIGAPIIVNGKVVPITMALMILLGLNTLFTFGVFFTVSYQVINRLQHPEKMIQHSSRDRQHQKKIFILLVIQALSPITFTMIPLLISYFFVLFEIQANGFANILPIFVSLPYLIDPFLVVYLVPAYKSFCGIVIEKMLCLRKLIEPIFLY